MNKQRPLPSRPQHHTSSALKRKRKQPTKVAGEGQRKCSPSSDERPNRSCMASNQFGHCIPSGKGKGKQPYHKAFWDGESTRIFLELVLKEIDVGNWPHITITQNGYRSLSMTFEAATGRLHEIKQLKNKYNLLKEWRAWSKLMDCRKGPIGIGFDQVTGLFNASPEWWARMEKIHKKCCKFRTKPLEHEELMVRVFIGAAATGKNAWMPSETSNQLEVEGEFDNPEFSIDGNELGASEMADMMHSANINALGSESKRKHSSGKAMQNKHATGAAVLATDMDDLVNSVKTQSTELTVNHVVGGHSVTMAQAVAQLYESQGMDLADPLLHFGLMLMEVPNNREMVEYSHGLRHYRLAAGEERGQSDEWRSKSCEHTAQQRPSLLNLLKEKLYSLSFKNL